MQALAEGGLQVWELAKLFFPSGHDIPMTQEKEKSLAQTNELLQREEVTFMKLPSGRCQTASASWISRRWFGSTESI